LTQGTTKIAQGLDWFLTNQRPDGLWETGYAAGKRAPENRCWVGLAACRVLKRFLSASHPRARNGAIPHHPGG